MQRMQRIASRARRVDALGKMLAAAVSKRPELPRAVHSGGPSGDGGGAHSQERAAEADAAPADSDKGQGAGATASELQGHMLAKALNDYFEEEDHDGQDADSKGESQEQQQQQHQKQLAQNRFLRADVITFVNRYRSIS